MGAQLTQRAVDGRISITANVQSVGEEVLMSNAKKTIGIVGYGQIGSYVYEQVASRPELGLEVVFVHDIDGERTAHLPQELVLDQVEDFASRSPDMVCELAHPDVSREYGAMFLEKTDYFLLSVTALADAELEATLRGAALDSGTRLYIPHGGVMGLDSIAEGRDNWEEVRFVMTKNPRNLDFRWSGMDASSVTGVTTLYEGPTRGICPKFPRNVNTHATVAVAGIGFDRTHSTLIADPSLNAAILEIYARGGGVDLELKRTGIITGVTGVATLRSVMGSLATLGNRGPGTYFC
jgi:aspartate dehydrogenase